MRQQTVMERRQELGEPVSAARPLRLKASSHVPLIGLVSKTAGVKEKSCTGIPREIPKQQQFPHFKVVLMLPQ
jgi:hypothetical protein